MKNNFTKDYLNISIRRSNANADISMTISSETGMCHKSQLYVNEKRLAEDLEMFWKSIKTKKVRTMSANYGQVDYYDNMNDVYETPSISIQRGLKKARIGSDSHGCVPKDWTFDLNCRFKDTSTSTPILEVVKSALGSYFTEKHEKELKKALKPFLQKKEQYASWEIEEVDY